MELDIRNGRHKSEAVFGNMRIRWLSNPNSSTNKMRVIEGESGRRKVTSKPKPISNIYNIHCKEPLHKTQMTYENIP